MAYLLRMCYFGTATEHGIFPTCFSAVEIGEPNSSIGPTANRVKDRNSGDGAFEDNEA